MRTRTYIGAQAVGLLTTVLLTILSGSVLQAEDNPSKEELIKKLECRADQPCDSPPASRRRGLQAPPQGKRGISFEPFTEQERKKLDEDARAGKLPAADLEVFFDYAKAEVIPSILSFDLWDPRVGAERFDAAGLGGKAPPGFAGGIDDGVVVVMQPVREEALLEVEPDALDRV